MYESRRSVSRAARGVLALVLGAGLGVVAQAQTWTWDAVVPNGASIEPASGGMRYDFRNLGASPAPNAIGSVYQGRTFGAPSSGATKAAAAMVNETYRLPGPAGSPLTVTASRSIPWGGIAKGIAGAAGYAGLAFTVGSALYDALADSRAYPPSFPGAQWNYDPGQPASTTQQTLWRVTQGNGTTADFRHLTARDACLYSAANPQAGQLGAGFSNTCLAGNNTTVFTVGPGCPVGQCVFQTIGLASQLANVNTCPAVIDFFGPMYSKPAGSPPGADGKCRTGQYQGIAAEAVADIIRDFGANPGNSPTIGPRIAEDILSKGGTIPDAAPGAITGPGSQTGPSSVTTETGPSGTTTTTKTPSYSYTYAPSSVTYNITTTTTTNNNGTVTTTTQTTNGGGGTKAADPTDPCTANPTRVGCTDIGTAPDDKVPKTSKTLSFSAEAIGLPSACPSPVSQLMNGTMQSVSYQPLCDAAVQAKPWLLACAWVAAISMVVAALRTM